MWSQRNQLAAIIIGTYFKLLATLCGDGLSPLMFYMVVTRMRNVVEVPQAAECVMQTCTE